MGTGYTIDDSAYPYICLIHLDRLSITFRHWSGSTFHDTRNPDNIPFEQVFENITLIHDNTTGLGSFYHSFKVLYKGYVIGRLHSATKLKKHEIQFDFAKEIFYSFSAGFWYEVFEAIESELGLIYNNIQYVEISIDTNKNIVLQFGYLYQNTINNQLRSGNLYQMRKNVMVNVMSNGSSFIVAGEGNEIAIYNKSRIAEDFILEYFRNNGLSGETINRVETRLTWNYIRYLRNKKRFDITVETLLDQKKLAEIFKISSINKIVFSDLEHKTYDDTRNAHYPKISIIDDLPIDTARIGILNPDLRMKHYVNDSVDENILRQNYYRYLETGNCRYFRNFISGGKVAGFGKDRMESLIIKFSNKYKGNRIPEVSKRMEDALSLISGRIFSWPEGLIQFLVLKVRLTLLSIF